MDDIDFKMEVTRDTFIKLNEDYFERVLGPMEKAITASGMTIGEVSEVILVGAGTRVPKVQEVLLGFLGAERELGKNLNTDEAAAMGAVYKAADLSTGFKVSLQFFNFDHIVSRFRLKLSILFFTFFVFLQILLTLFLSSLKY